MLFSQAQVLELTGMSLERLRHWRKKIPALGSHSGRIPSFTFDELAALAVMSRMADELDLGLAAIAPHAASIFALFAEDEDVGLEGTALCLSSNDVKLVRLPFEPAECVIAMVRIDVLLADLYERVRPQRQRSQLPLPL